MSSVDPATVELSVYVFRVIAPALDALLSLDHPLKIETRDWADQSLPTSDEMRGRLVDRDLWQLAAERGILGVCIPKDLGGSGLSHVDTALVFEGLGLSSADNGVVFAIASQALAANKAIADSATPEQAARWVPALADGSTFASFAMSEPDAGSDPASVTTVAIEVDGGWRLTGQKTWATLAPIADLAVVFAMTDSSLGQWGLSAFVVETASKGVGRSTPIAKLGLQSSPFGDLVFEDCFVPTDQLLGRVGSGAAIFRSVVEAERAFLYAAQIGAMESVIDRAVTHARRRRQAGVHIGSHQAVSHRIVDMRSRHESARLHLYKAAALADLGRSVTLAAALTKIATADAAVHCAIDGMRTFGASGYTDEIGLEVEVRDALAGLSYSGTTDVTKNVVAALLGVNRPS